MQERQEAKIQKWADAEEARLLALSEKEIEAAKAAREAYHNQRRMKFVQG